MHYHFFLILALLLSGCSSSRVILLDGQKTKSAIIVSTQAGQEVLDKPNTYTELSSKSEKPKAKSDITVHDISENYGVLLENTPKPPVSFLLYFKRDSTQLNEDSLKKPPLIKKAIKARIPCDVNVIGHSDTIGTKEYNIMLSKKRAKSIKKWIQNTGLDIDQHLVDNSQKDLVIQLLFEFKNMNV